MFNLYDVTQVIESITRDKPRNATPKEVRAYLRWLADRDGIAIPANAEYRPEGITVCGEVIVPMPGYGQPQIATCEIIGDNGEVVRRMTLPADKRGKLPMTAKQVQDWTGLAPVRKSRRKTATPIAVAEPEAVAVPENCSKTAQETQDAVPMGSVEPETVDALHGAPADNPEPVSDACELPASDPIAAIEARLAEVEALLATLSANAGASTSDSAPANEAAKPEATPTVAKRSAAHERAIRRAWNERKAARSRADLDRRTLEAANGAYRGAMDALAKANAERDDLKAEIDARDYVIQQLKEQRDAVRADAEAWKASSNQHWREVEEMGGKRDRATARARRMIVAARAVADEQRKIAAMAKSELAKLRRDMADPAQPERASDIARLVRERDEARNANAALQGRAERAERAVNELAERFEGMVSRVARAEAAVRSLAA